MKPRAHLEAEFAYPFGDCAGTADCPHGAIERREEAIACGIDFAPAELIELSANQRMMTSNQFVPAVVPELRSAFSGPNNVREQDGCQHRLGLGFKPDVAYEAARLLRHVVDEPDRLISVRQLESARR